MKTFTLALLTAAVMAKEPAFEAIGRACVNSALKKMNKTAKACA